MARKITITVKDDLTEDEYADLANALWMFMRNTQFDFHVLQDPKADPAAMNAAWKQYGDDASWS